MKIEILMESLAAFGLVRMIHMWVTDSYTLLEACKKRFCKASGKYAANFTEAIDTGFFFTVGKVIQRK